jgi:ribonuclease VapC
LSARPLLVESSALVAIILEEPGWEALAQQAVDAARAITTSVNVFEAVLAVTRERGIPPTQAHPLVETVVERLGLDIIAISAPMIPAAAQARETYGAGRHGLNLGDCLSYAAAKHHAAKLLYVGDDFSRTDVNA